MRKIAAVTVGRSDFGIYLPVLREITARADCELQLIAAAGHLSSKFGDTLKEIVQQGFEIAESVPMLLANDSPECIAQSMALGLMGFGSAYRRLKPDMLLVLGDRFEMHAAALAAVPFSLPIAHIHGGETTEGAIDEVLRHSITKFSHLHFPSTEEYGRRIIQLGEEPWRVTVAGAPALDNLRQLKLLSKLELEQRLAFQLPEPPIMVTFHPTTLRLGNLDWQIEQLLQVLGSITAPIIITKPNADSGSMLIMERLERFAANRPNVKLVDNLGTLAYFSCMSIARVMVGNSSSGIIEAASFGLPVVNIGIRQQGRARGANVIDVGHPANEIEEGLRTALSSAFVERLKGLKNPYGEGTASSRIVDVLSRTVVDERLLIKKFHNLGN